MTRNPQETRFEHLQLGGQEVPISYWLKHLPCGKEDCLHCLTGQGHGPYWYAQFTLGGQERNVFLGKRFKPLDINKILVADFMNRRRQQDQTPGPEPAPANPSPDLMEEAKAHWVEKIDLGKLTKKARSPQQESKPLPSRRDFERDLHSLKRAPAPEGLKQLYRQLIKKYHPDQFEGNQVMNGWMSEINGEYHLLLSRAKP